MDQLSVGALACAKAIPDLERLTDAIPVALKELQDATHKKPFSRFPMTPGHY